MPSRPIGSSSCNARWGGFCIPSKIRVPESGEVKNNYDPEHEKPSEAAPLRTHYPATGRVLFTIEFYVRHVRDIVAERLAEEASILGEDESSCSLPSAPSSRLRGPAGRTKRSSFRSRRGLGPQFGAGAA
jgi:hypothetical protein